VNGGGELVRWEARSHEQIYHEVHREEARPVSHSLAETVPMYKEFCADLREVRSRYESLVRRLMGGSAGTGAEAASVAAGIVFRGLSDAYELTSLAGSRRGKFYELNEHLRRTMPEPSGAPENTSGFTGHGRAWLNPPDFESEDNARQGEGERARDLMRDYERSLAVLDGSGHAGSPTVAAAAVAVDRHIDGSTVPLATARRGFPAVRPHRPDHPVPPVLDGARHWTAAQPQAAPSTPAGPVDFGPAGHADDEQKTEGRAAGGALGNPPPPREDEWEMPRSRREDNELFPSDGKASPPVIGL
jgi:hypothetical protein